MSFQDDDFNVVAEVTYSGQSVGKLANIGGPSGSLKLAHFAKRFADKYGIIGGFTPLTKRFHVAEHQLILTEEKVGFLKSVHHVVGPGPT
jgi:hypothetical protein